MKRLARLTSVHPVRVLVLAGVAFIVAAVLGGPLVNLLDTSLSDFEDPSSQTSQAQRQIEHATGNQDQAGLVVLLRGPAEIQTSASARDEEARIVGLLRREPGFHEAIDYGNSRDSEFISSNHDQALMLVTFRTRKDAYEAAQHVRRLAHESNASFGGLDVIFEELTRRSRTDFERAELLVLPLLFLISMWVFRGALAALLPLVIGGFTILLTFLCLRIVDQFLGLSVFALNLVSALGLGLAIDYSLFVLSRYREELAGQDAGDAAGRPARELVGVAIGRTLRTAGRTVLFSSITVAAAMAALLVFPLPFLYSMGIAGIFTSLVAGASALIVLPAILALLGKRIDAFTPAFMRRSGGRAAGAQTAGSRSEGSRSEGFWARLAKVVTRRPGMIAVGSAALLLVAGAPVFEMALTPASSTLLPASSQARQVDEAIRRNFGDYQGLPIAAVVQASPNEFENVVAYGRKVARLSGEPAQDHLLYLQHDTWLIAVPPRGNPFSKANERLVRQMRALPAPNPAVVGGITAWFMDERSSLESQLPLAFAIVALTMFATIFVMTGSVVLPLKMLIMNLLTLSATTGALVLAFQKGGLGPLLGFNANGGLEPSNLVLLYVLVFALASDYGVFLLSRMKEAYDAGLPNREAVAAGLERTGRLITAAALLFCVAVGALVTSSILAVKELGFGAALAVAIDATIVRALLVPSLMMILGDWNWWSPAPLRRLHERFGMREEAHPT